MTVCTKQRPLYHRNEGEDYYDYFVRLFDRKEEYALNCVQIAELLNAQNGMNYGESAYRKEFRAFDRGRTYERNKSSIGVATRILAISDLHVPFQLPVETFRDYVGATDVLVINGDIEDCQSVSAFPKSYRIPLVEEMIQARQYLIDLILYISPREVYITRGNHEDRLLRLMSNKLGEDVLNIMPDSPIDLIVNDGFKNRDRLNHTDVFYTPIRDVFPGLPIHYSGDWWCKVGRTIFAHPLAYSSGILKTTEKAVDYFLRVDRDFDAVVLAHTHKLGQYVQGGIHMIEQGCCCRTEELNYADGKLTYPQQKGFVYICHDSCGSFMHEQTKLIQL